jgi:hypothetical protein
MTATIFKNAVAEFTSLGTPDGIIYIEGRRGTLTTTSAGLIGNIGQFTKIDYLPTSGTNSVGIAINLLVDTTFPPQGPVSGTAYPVLFSATGTSAGQTSRLFGDNWTAT